MTGAIPANSRSAAAVGAAVASALFLTTFLPWGAIGFEFSNGFLEGTQGYRTTINAWDMHASLDLLFAAAAVAAACVNFSAASTGKSTVTDAVAMTNVTAGIVAATLAIWTIAMPPLPSTLDVMNGMPGGFHTVNEPRFGVFVALGMAVTLTGVGLLQIVAYRRGRAARGGPTSAPATGQYSSPPAGSSVEPFIDPVTGKRIT